MKPYYADGLGTVWHGDCLDVLANLPDSSVDAVVTDPPYSLAFMGRAWDSHPTPAAFQAWCQLWATECLRILKPGGHLLAFGGTRTWHRLTCAIEDAGFEIRDSIAWLYGSGFPKSLDVSKAIDRAAGVEREVIGPSPHSSHRGASSFQADDGPAHGYVGNPEGDRLLTAPATPDAQQWSGWGTALKPAHEPIVVARKPIVGTVAANVLQHGTGALNIDGCRIGEGGQLQWARPRDMGYRGGFDAGTAEALANASGRWPANVILDETQAEALDQMSGETTSPPVGSVARTQGGNTIGTFAHVGREPSPNGHGDIGGASRFFYTAKAGSDERITHAGTAHPTVKPLALMRWLVRLVTPPGGVILEPFAGSGTTVEAAILEGFRCIAIEREADYLPLITQRIHRRRDPIAYLSEGGHDLGLFDYDPDAA